ncbi:B-cell lymphoma 6 protein homolog isoform X4 [Maniola jurtina]|uniref:B-cell lymphoma 6 protein homolog isoform X4 n=1 Tax=Maniola jurtina TaxID=191418 RepID=UPI001E686A37|nr:B-cell lymphoma 6 protein homolog isoform X4 [Maniola jurtina]
MATKTWKIEKDLCRCCHAEGAFDNLAEPRTFLDKVEVYSDMLRECLDIDIPPVPGELCAITYTICNACIARLRDACNFKKQVQDCEQRFMTLYYKNAIQGLKPATKVKEEIEVSIERPQSDTEADNIVLKKEDEDDDDDHFLGGDDDDGMSDDDLPIKPPKQSVSTMKTRPKPKPKPKAPPVVKKLKPPPKPKKKEEPKPAKEKKGNTKSLPDGDYRRDGDTYICNHCDKTCVQLTEMLLHSCSKPVLAQQGIVVRPGEYRTESGKFICNYCDKRYRIMRGLRKHLTMTTKDCPYCELRFCNTSAFIVHKLNVHNVDDRINCEACDFKCSSKMVLDRHLKIFHKLGKIYSCKQCDYDTFNVQSLYRHRVNHTTVKRFVCTFCGKTFLRLQTLKMHKRIHTNERTKVCKVCQQAFVQKASLNYHMKKYHPEAR